MFNYLSLNNQKTLLITNDENKNKILKEIMSLNKLLNIKIMSISELKNRLFFEPTSQAFTTIYYKFNKPLSIINKIINYLYYIDLNKEYNNPKLNELKEIKQYLLINNLLKIDNRFKIYLKEFKIYFIDFPIIDKEINFIINELNKFTNVEIIDRYLNNFTPALIHLNTIEDEITYVCYSISKLLEQGININNIKLCNVNNDYNFYLKRIFKNYNIPLNINENTPLSSLFLSNVFINLLKENSKEETINILKEKYPNYIDYINQYISILNKYVYLDKLDLKLINYELKNTNIKNKKKINAIEIINLDEIGNSNYHVFVMSCNYDEFPKIIKDEDYLIDKEKELLHLSTSKEQNINNINKIKKLIKSSQHIYLSYKDKSYFNEFHKVDFLDLNETEFNKDILNSYSINEDKIMLTKYLDHNIINNDSKILNYNYNVNYKEYDYSFKGIDKELLNKSFEEKNLTISYSSLNKYYECAFKYYIDSILKLTTFEDNINTIIGNIMHRVLQDCYKENFDFEKSFEYYKNMYLIPSLKASELFFIDNIKSKTLEVVNFLKSSKNDTRLTDYIHELNINFNIKKEDTLITIKGFIDKLIYKEIDDVIYTALIDFKTGNDEIKEDRFEYGLSLQLPFYIYLLKNNNKFKDSKILGIYIQNILNSVNDKTTLKLNGFSISDINYLPILDKTYQNSSFIKGLKTNKSGILSSKKVLTEEEFNNLSILVEEKINNMIDNILKGNFEINPKKMDNNTDLSCTYCPYSSICYKTNKDYKYLK